MLRVRPGVELVLATFAPSRELIKLDLPTFDRPRNATSGSVGAGKWPASIADIRNRANTRMHQCAVSPGKVASGKASAAASAQPERPLVLDIFLPDRPQLMPQKKNPRRHQPNPQTDQEKPPVSRKRNQQNRNHSDRNDQTSSPAERSPGLNRLKPRFHAAPRNAPLFYDADRRNCLLKASAC